MHRVLLHRHQWRIFKSLILPTLNGIISTLANRARTLLYQRKLKVTWVTTCLSFGGGGRVVSHQHRRPLSFLGIDVSHNITLLLNYFKHHLFRGNLVFLKKHSIAWLGCFWLSGWTKCSLNKLLLSFTELRKMNAPMGRSPYLRSRSKEADTIGCCCVALRPVRTKVINCVHLQGEVRVPILSIQIHTLNMFFPMLWLLLMKPPLFYGTNAWFNLPQLLKDFLYTKP